MELRLNLFNFVLKTGCISDMQQRDNGLLFFLKGQKGNVPVLIRDERIWKGLKNGDYVCVRGKLRFSSDKGSFKIIGGKVNVIPADVDINLALIEAYYTGLEKTDKFTRFTFKHMALNPEGIIYPLPIDMVCFGARADKIEREIVKPDTLFLIEGRLSYDNEKKAYNILGDHVTNREPIMREV